MVNLPTHRNINARQARRLAKTINDTRERYQIRPICDQTVWDAFLKAQNPPTFLQSWTWGEQYEQSGSHILRIGAFDNEKLVGVALLIKIVARRGTFLLCPHGPIVDRTQEPGPILGSIFTRATEIGRTQHCDFLRFCPIDGPSQTLQETYARHGFRPAPIHMHPELSWMLDLEPNEENLLKDMRKTTRYLIKKTEKDGVEIVTSTNPDDIEKFWPVYQATVNRQHFTPFPKAYLRREFELFARNSNAMFFFGAYQNTIIAAAIIIFSGDSAFYHHSGSVPQFTNINASSLLQWHVIQEAKRRGCKLYNFWGISPDHLPKHPWAGLSLFKKGFGGFAEEYLHAQDKPLTPKYWLNFAVETIRKVRRGY